MLAAGKIIGCRDLNTLNVLAAFSPQQVYDFLDPSHPILNVRVREKWLAPEDAMSTHLMALCQPIPDIGFYAAQWQKWRRICKVIQ